MICEYGCGKEAGHQFKNGKWCCSGDVRSCSGIEEKKKQTYMKKYGVDNPLKNKEIREKMKQTCLEKYGVDNPGKNKKVQEKMKQTCMEKYGVDHPWQSKEVQEKMKHTCLKKYGVDNPLKNKEVQEKKKQTCLENLGVEYPAQSRKAQEKMKQTCMKKYGVDYPSQSKEVKEKVIQTNLERYGSEHYKQSLEAKEKLLERQPFLCQIEEIKIEDNQFKVHCKYSECINSKEKGGWFTPTMIQIDNRIAALKIETGNGGNYFYCSQQCKKDCTAFNVRVDPNRDTESIYAPGDYETFRLYVLTRDKYICQFCGAPATDVHHEIAVKLQPFHALDPEYAWSCCEKCHYEKGHKKGTACSTGNLAAKVCVPVIKKKENFI